MLVLFMCLHTYLDLYRVVLYWSAKPILKRYRSLCTSVQTLAHCLAHGLQDRTSGLTSDSHHVSEARSHTHMQSLCFSYLLFFLLICLL